jgi:pimeloyl-ACP methyl ester carboxylesterase
VDDAEAACAHLSDTTGALLGLADVGAGARIALALARAHPEVRRVVLIDPAPAPGVPPPARILVILPENGASLDAESAGALAGTEGSVEIVRGADASWQSGLPAAAKAVAWLEAARGRP